MLAPALEKRRTCRLLIKVVNTRELKAIFSDDDAAAKLTAAHDI
jgi:hypothetical protein